MTNEHTPTGTDRRTPGRHVDPVNELRRITARLHDLEKEAAALGGELAAMESSLRSALATRRVPIMAYTIEEAAEAIGLSRSTVAALISSGELASIKRGGDGFRRVLPEDLQAYLESLRTPTEDRS